MTIIEKQPTFKPLLRTPLYALHVELGARMVPFAGYEMPVQFPLGLMKEHLHTREAAGLFDVSHMGQAYLVGRDHNTVAEALERLVPGNILGLAPGKQRYTQLLNADGGIIDDLMVTRPASSKEDGRLMLVVNGERKDVDYAHIAARLPDDVRLEIENDYALVALQGPKAAAVISKVCPEAVELPFMGAVKTSLGGLNCHVTRSGYTGEDGFEISFDAGDVEEAARLLLANPSVQPIGLGARDTLRLEAGLCLYGHDIDEITSPIEADLAWSIAKRRREQGGFPGTDRVQRELRDGPSRKRVGFKLSGRAPAREGCIVQSLSGEPIGKITSGTFAPSLGAPISMGYVTASHAVPGTTVNIVIRETPYSAHVTAFPFVPNRYHRTSS